MKTNLIEAPSESISNLVSGSEAMRLPSVMGGDCHA